MSHELSELLEQIKFHLYNGLVTARGWEGIIYQECWGSHYYGREVIFYEGEGWELIGYQGWGEIPHLI